MPNITKKGLRVVYAEDEVRIREIFGRILGDLASEVFIAEDGQQALDMFFAHNPDIIITDITMPNLNGFELSREIRKSNKTIPIIAITAHNDTQYLSKAIEVGITSFLPKPVDIEKLIEAIDNASRIVFLEKEQRTQSVLLEQYKKAVDVSSMLIKLSANGDITYTNTQFCDIMGYTEKEILSKTYKILQSDDMSDTDFEEMWSNIKQSQTWQGIIKTKDPYDLTLWLNATIVPILNEKNEIQEIMALFLNITDIKYKQHELEQEKQVSAMILDMQNSITAFATNEFGMLRANRALFDFTGFSDITDFHNTHSRLSDLFLDEDGFVAKEDAKNWENLRLKCEAGNTLKVKMLDKNQKSFIFELQIRKAFIKEYDFLSGYDFYIISLHNITEFENAVSLAQEAERSKSEFLANISHEIRTPMNGIIGFADLLEKTSLDKAQSEYIKIISQSADHLLGIINDVLDFSKIESGKFTIEQIDFNPSDEIGSTIELFGAKAIEKNITLASFIDPRIPILIGDPMRLKQVLYNFLSNAVKFTPENGYIKVLVEQVSSTDNKCSVRFSVTDTGIGIDSDKIQNIFTPFAQADSSISRKFGGTGLGLSICNKIIGLMGSQILLKSVKNIGSEFYFEINFNISSASENKTEKNIIDNVLVLDKELMQKTLIFEYLSALGVKNYLENINNISDANVVIFGSEKLSNIKSIAIDNPSKIFICITKQFDEQYSSVSNIRFVSLPLNANNILSAVFDDNTQKNVKQPVEQNKQKQFDNKKVLVAEDNPVNQKLINILLTAKGLKVVNANDGLEAVKIYNNESFDLIFMDIHMPNLDGLGALTKIKEINQNHPPIIALTANALKGDKERFLEAGFTDYISKPIEMPALDRVLGLYLDLQTTQQSTQEEQMQHTDNDYKIDVEELEHGLGLDKETIQMLLDGFKEDSASDIDELNSAINDKDFLRIKEMAHKLKGACGNLRIKLGAHIALEIETHAKQNSPDFNYAEKSKELKLIIDKASL